jgi:hypothetical protein
MKSANELGRAWIITREGSAWPQEVVAIVSARRSDEFIKHTLELLYGLISYNADGQFSAARWNNPKIPYRASAIMPGHSTAFDCGDNPFLIARLGRKVRLDTALKVPMLEWQQPDRFELSASGPVKRTTGLVRSAPVRLVFQSCG